MNKQLSIITTVVAAVTIKAKTVRRDADRAECQLSRFGFNEGVVQ